MKNMSNMISLFTKMLCSIFVITAISACDTPHNGTRKFAIDLTKQMNDKICPAGYSPSQPCGGRDVRFDADWGAIAYINIYGVTNESEIDRLIKFATKFRDERDKRIPVDLTFYSDLEKSHQLKHVKLQGE